VTGEEQLEYVGLSSEHSKVAPLGSLELKEKPGVLSLEGDVGFVPMVAVGCTVSTFHANESGELE
jgi:hypothetical protein